jgi:ribose transport system ATP-binding protein
LQVAWWFFTRDKPLESITKQTLSIEGVSKRFPGVQALDEVNFSLTGGEIHGIVGENGAGKSTLIKILMGVYQMDSGTIHIDGKTVQIHNPLDARDFGLFAVYQDVVVSPELSVGENFFTGKLPKNRFGFVDWKTVFTESEETLHTLGIDVNPRNLISSLTPGEQAMVTIAKIVKEKAKFVIFDEPTARLTNEESDQLFELIQRLKQNNIGIIYISHHLEEIFDICDQVTVLRDGCLVGTLPIDEVDEDRLISMMVGRPITEMYAIDHSEPGDVVLEVKNLTSESNFSDINLTLHKGEVLGIFGLVGSGRTQLLRALFGAKKYQQGEIIVNGKITSYKTPTNAMKHGIALVPEDRKLEGLALPLSVKININIASYEMISRLGFVNGRKESERSQQMVDEMNIRTPNLEQVLMNLSGGNQQKVAIAKWLCENADILLLDEPTTGVDVGAKVEIYRLIETLVQEGKSVIICSSYLPEIMGLSNRILVMAEGEITGEVANKDASEELLLRLASKVPVNITTQ